MTRSWTETGSRKLVHHMMDDFNTAADAFFELADNPIDYRLGRHLVERFEIQREQDRIIVLDYGGEGMDDAGIADWLQWGTGHPHGESDIGQFHKGGKAACGYLASGVRIFSRRHGATDVWKFEDPEFATREEWADFGQPEPFQGELPQMVEELVPDAAGFTYFELFKLRADRRYNIERLKWLMSSFYRALLGTQNVEIWVNGEQVKPLDLRLSETFPKERLIVAVGKTGRKIVGWVGRLDRDSLRASGPQRVPGGIRCLYNGRLIRAGEFFGYMAEGQGAAQSLIGEVDLSFVPVLSNKTDFQRGTEMWELVEDAMRERLLPIINEFKKAADARPISREERKAANRVRNQLEQAAQAVLQSRIGGNGATPSDAIEPYAGGRNRGRQGGTVVEGSSTESDADRTRGPHRDAATEAPPDAVGTLTRLRRRLIGGFPLIRWEDSDPNVRSRVEPPDGPADVIFANRRFPLCRELKQSDAYLAETAVLEWCKPASGERLEAADYIDAVNELLLGRSRVVAE